MNTKFFHTMRGIAVCAVSTLMLTTFVACSDDDEPTPTQQAETPTIPAPQTFSGKLTTTVPSMQSFEPINDDNTAVITWGNPEQTSATIKLGAFKIKVQTPMGERAYEIGEMNIADIVCTKSGDKMTLTNPAFECQAGNFATTGTFEGELTDGSLTFKIVYKPGSMPFDVQSVFVGK